MLSKSDLAARYIALLKKSLINELYIENEARVVLVVDSLLNRRSFELGHLSGIGREVALLSALRKAKDDGSSVHPQARSRCTFECCRGASFPPSCAKAR